MVGITRSKVIIVFCMGHCSLYIVSLWWFRLFAYMPLHATLCQTRSAQRFPPNGGFAMTRNCSQKSVICRRANTRSGDIHKKYSSKSCTKPLTGGLSVRRYGSSHVTKSHWLIWVGEELGELHIYILQQTYPLLLIGEVWRALVLPCSRFWYSHDNYIMNAISWGLHDLEMRRFPPRFPRKSTKHPLNSGPWRSSWHSFTVHEPWRASSSKSRWCSQWQSDSWREKAGWLHQSHAHFRCNYTNCVTAARK